MSIKHPEAIAIIGGGFSGVMTGVNLARLSQRPLQITLINQHCPLGRGLAYGTRRPEHLLNVAARNMSAFPDLPDHFLQWLRTRSEYENLPDPELAGRFIPRLVYGDYLRGLMHQYLMSPDKPAMEQPQLMEAEAVDVEPERHHVNVKLADGRKVRAEKVVLATGHEAPAGFPGSAELHDHPAWIGNPWQAWTDQLPAAGGTVVLLGAGLTTVDAIITLRALGWTGQVEVVSRNGWLPNSHFRGIENPEFPPPDVNLAALGLKELVALVESHCARLRGAGANPAIVVDRLRPHTQRIWKNFTTEDKRAFVREHSARWNVLRHRIAPEIHAQVTAAQASGQLQVHAAGIERVGAEGNQVRVHLKNGETLTGDLVINATGPQTRFSNTNSVLMKNLIKRGLVAVDDMEMGIRADEDHRVIARDGQCSDFLLAIGPLLRGTLWETIAVPELRGQARRVAETILEHTPLFETMLPEVVMEYSI
ncbi:MAG TPA: FAD/NAD(P)-binding protein [Candidatus Sulfotelmatobacter sp.]|nr:FAD/NAD(P)-binding protein [Candidatus Sulfotelmatobacter sp.]